MCFCADCWNGKEFICETHYRCPSQDEPSTLSRWWGPPPSPVGTRIFYRDSYIKGPKG